MNQNLLNDLKALLSQDDRLVVDGQVLKNKVIELGLAMDAQLIKLLLSTPTINTHFFVDVDGVKVFDKIKFQQFVSNKEFLPDSYTAYKNKVGLSSGDHYLADSKEVVLAWPYKDCVLEGGQTKDDAKRTEVFWNETLAPDQIDCLLSPKVLANFTRHDKEGNHKVSSISPDDNLVIKGNNLLSLYTLKKAYAGKIDVIYIDPPYNPDSKSNTFCYNNTFNRSTWLTFIKNRLDVAKQLLKRDGALVVAIDENEQAHLGVLLKDMFLEHDVHCITIVHNPRGVQGTNFSYVHEYAFFVLPKGKKIIGNKKIDESEVDWSPLRNWGGESERSDAKNCFYPIIVENEKIIGFGDVCDDNEHPKQTVKVGSKYFIYPIDTSGVERKWRYARQSVEEIAHLLCAKKTKTGYDIKIGKDFGVYKTVWTDPRYDANAYGTQLVKSLVPGCKFDFPKSLWNVYDCLYAITANNKDAIVLDFFGGSGTTAHAVLELNKDDNGNRKFILCEQMHYIESVTVPRIHRVVQDNIAGSFVYCELRSANQTYIDQIQEAKDNKELQKIWKKMQETAFLSYKIDPKTINVSGSDFVELALDSQKRFMIEVLDKNMLYVPLSEIEDKSYGVTAEDKKLNLQLLGAV
ncbi:MAG: site-specific DNA-methyltransferase [Alphaproteobacteria bacterium]|nr:site-specific DNA-methyltransferase [Alphaproteobacteria bacterium]